MFAEAFCVDYSATRDASKERGDEFLPLLEALDRVHQIAKGILALLGPWPGARGSDASHAQDLFNYLGNKPEEMLLKDSLQSSPIWKGLLKELASKGTASVAAVEEVRNLCLKLQAQDIEMDVLTTGIVNYQKWKGQLLTRMVEEVQKHLGRAVVAKAQETLNVLEGGSKDLPAQLSKSHIETLLAGLQLFNHIPAALQVFGKLQKAQVKHGKTLAIEELKFLAEKFPGQRKEDESFIMDLPAIADFEKALHHCMESVKKQGLPEHFEHVIWWLWRRMLMKFQDLFFVFVVLMEYDYVYMYSI